MLLTSGEVVYILATDLEEAAWLASEVSRGKHTKLKDVIPTHVKEQILSEQLARDQARS